MSIVTVPRWQHCYSVRYLFLILNPHLESNPGLSRGSPFHNHCAHTISYSARNNSEQKQYECKNGVMGKGQCKSASDSSTAHSHISVYSIRKHHPQWPSFVSEQSLLPNTIGDLRRFHKQSCAFTTSRKGTQMVQGGFPNLFKVSEYCPLKIIIHLKVHNIGMCLYWMLKLYFQKS